MRLRFLLTITAAALLCSSCVVYHPHNVDIPLLEQRGDLRIDASANITLPLLDGSGINATVAYAPFDMLGVQAAASLTDGRNYHVQAAAGTYNPLGERSVLECYFGAAYGHSYSDAASNNNYVEGSYGQFFSQMNYGWNHLANDALDLGFGLKCGLLDPDMTKFIHDGDGNVTATPHTDIHFLVEPQFMVRFGWQHFKFSLNVAYSHISDWPTDDNYFNYTRFSIGLGVNYKF